MKGIYDGFGLLAIFALQTLVDFGLTPGEAVAFLCVCQIQLQREAFPFGKVGADEQRYVFGDIGIFFAYRFLRNQAPVQARRPGKSVAPRAAYRRDFLFFGGLFQGFVGRIVDLIRGKAVQFGETVFVHAQVFQRQLGYALRRFLRGQGHPYFFHRTALHYRFMEQALGTWHGHQGQDFRSAARFAEDGDVIRVAAELVDIGFYPFQCRHQVLHAHVGGIFVWPAVCG